MEKTFKCNKCSYKIIIKNKKAKNKSLVKIKKHEFYCKGEKNYVQTDKKVNDLEDNTNETDSINSTEESGDILGSETMVGSTAYHQETL